MSNQRIYYIMKKIIKFFILSIIINLILINSYEIIESIRFSFSLCINNLFPALIPFMLLSNILIKYNFINDIGDLLKKTMNKIFKVNKNCSFVLIMSILSGTPSNAKYLNDLLNNNLIDINDCKKCLAFCHFTNPIFIIGTIGLTFLNNKKTGLIIMISHYLAAIIIGLFNKKNFIIVKSNVSNAEQKTNNFIAILKESINNTISSLLLILGIITTCIILTTIINNIIILNDNLKFIYGLIEMTQGLKYLSQANLSFILKAMISSFLISFGGFCIHAQVFCILDNKKIRYLPYFISRIFQGLLSMLLTFIIMKFIN